MRSKFLHGLENLLEIVGISCSVHGGIDSAVVSKKEVFDDCLLHLLLLLGVRVDWTASYPTYTW